MSLLGTITALANYPAISGLRTAAGSRTLGRYAAGSTTPLALVNVVVQPMSGRTMRTLPEGIRAEDVRVLLTATQLYTQTATLDPDQLTIDGETYKVFRVEPWTLGSETFYRAWAARQGRP